MHGVAAVNSEGRKRMVTHMEVDMTSGPGVLLSERPGDDYTVKLLPNSINISVESYVQ